MKSGRVVTRIIITIRIIRIVKQVGGEFGRRVRCRPVLPAPCSLLSEGRADGKVDSSSRPSYFVYFGWHTSLAVLVGTSHGYCIVYHPASTP